MSAVFEARDRPEVKAVHLGAASVQGKAVVLLRITGLHGDPAPLTLPVAADDVLRHFRPAV